MTTAQRKALFDTSTNKIAVSLAEISSPGATTLYLADNLSNVVSNGNTYQAAGMVVKKPDKGSSVQSGSLQFSAVPIEYIQFIQELPTDAEITVRLFDVFLDDPDTPIDLPFDFTVANANIQDSSGMIELELTVINPMDFIASVDKYESSTCPGMFV